MAGSAAVPAAVRSRASRSLRRSAERASTTSASLDAVSARRASLCTPSASTSTENSSRDCTAKRRDEAVASRRETDNGCTCCCFASRNSARRILASDSSSSDMSGSGSCNGCVSDCPCCSLVDCCMGTGNNGAISSGAFLRASQHFLSSLSLRRVSSSVRLNRPGQRTVLFSSRAPQFLPRARHFSDSVSAPPSQSEAPLLC